MGKRFSLLLLGPVLVALYATVMVLTIAVWDPAAAVPGLAYPEILARLDSAGVNVAGAIVGLIVWAALGIGLALVPSILRATGLVGVSAAIAGHLAVIASGAAAYFMGSMSLGMDVADTFGVGGGDHTPWGGVLYAVSALAVLGLAAIGIRCVALAARRP